PASELGKALRGALDGVQPQPRWPACKATAYRRGPAPAPGATELGLSGGRDARIGGKELRAEGQAGRLVFVQTGCGGERRSRACSWRKGALGKECSSPTQATLTRRSKMG